MSTNAKQPNKNEPATKGDIAELAAMLSRVLEHYATKDDLNNAIEASEERTKNVIRESEERTEKIIKASEKRVIYEFNALAEHIHQDVSGANKDEISGKFCRKTVSATYRLSQRGEYFKDFCKQTRKTLASSAITFVKNPILSL